MAARTTLAQYVLDRIYERHESAEEFANRIGINASGLYKFLRGAYTEPRQATLDKIASGLGMTPAELLTAVGKGAIDSDPDETEVLALYRQLADEHRPTVKSMLRGLTVQPVNKGPDNRRRDVQGNRARERSVEKDTHREQQGQNGLNESETPRYALPWQFPLSVFRRLERQLALAAG